MDETDEGRIEALSGQMERLNGLTEQFGRALSRSLSQGITQGKSFEDILRGIGQRFLDIALRSAFKPLEGMIAGAGQSLLGGIGNLFSGGGIANGPPLSITPFAEGGVVSAPHYFPMGRGLGLMGEKGAEAIMPLARGPDGRLGVAAQGGRAVSVVMNITTPDAQSFRRSETQLSAALARAVGRGTRGL